MAITSLDNCIDFISFCRFLETLENPHKFLMRSGAKIVAPFDEETERTYQLGEITVSFDGKNWF